MKLSIIRLMFGIHDSPPVSDTCTQFAKMAKRKARFSERLYEVCPLVLPSRIVLPMVPQWKDRIPKRQSLSVLASQV
jgi:hypothetical protein